MAMTRFPWLGGSSKERLRRPPRRATPGFTVNFQRGKDGSTDSFVQSSTCYAVPLVDFHGWMMPLHYGGSQIDEHHAVRTDAGMFDDVSCTIGRPAR